MSTKTGLITSTPLCGCYGKLPAVGDFVNYHLPADFVSQWDEWLQTVILAGKENLQDQWLSSYLTCPIYHFILAPDLLGESGRLGVMVPSVDRVGRYFPLMVCAPLHQQANLNCLHSDYAEWFSEAESLLLACLDEMSVEQLKEGLQGLDHVFLKAQSQNNSEMAAKMTIKAVRFSVGKESELKEMFSLFLNSRFFEANNEVSIWWSEGSEQVEASAVIHQGMPSKEHAMAFFDGQWQKWGWG